MLKKLLLLLVAVVAILLVVIWLQPDDFRLERSVTIAAPASVVFPYVNDLRRFSSWSPFANGETGLEETFSEAISGVGATYQWKGEKTGEGRMTILESRPDAFVSVRLEFLAPMEATDLTEYTLQPVDGGTRMTWAMSGPNLFLGKALNLFGGMEAMVGPQFEEGLETLKSLAETEAAAGAARGASPVEGSDSAVPVAP